MILLSLFQCVTDTEQAVSSFEFVNRFSQADREIEHSCTSVSEVVENIAKPERLTPFAAFTR